MPEFRKVIFIRKGDEGNVPHLRQIVLPVFGGKRRVGHVGSSQLERSPKWRNHIAYITLLELRIFARLSEKCSSLHRNRKPRTKRSAELLFDARSELKNAERCG